MLEETLNLIREKAFAQFVDELRRRNANLALDALDFLFNQEFNFVGDRIHRFIHRKRDNILFPKRKLRLLSPLRLDKGNDR